MFISICNGNVYVYVLCRDLYDKLELNFQAPAPQLVSATLYGACNLRIKFDMRIADVTSCSDALDQASVTKLGSGKY